MTELFTNNAASRLAAGISDSDTSLTVKTGAGDLYPSPSGGDFFRLVLVNLSSGEYEIAFCTSRTGDVLTISRAAEDATDHPARAFVVDDPVELRPTAGFFNSLSVTSTNVQANQFNVGVDTGAANAYEVALSPALVGDPPPNGMTVSFVAQNGNTSASSVNVNGQGFNDIKIGTRPLVWGDIGTLQMVMVVYNSSLASWQLISSHNPRFPNRAYGIAWLSAVGPLAINSNIPIHTGSPSFIDVTFDSVGGDAGNEMWSGVNPTRMTVPAGATKVRLVGQVLHNQTDTHVVQIHYHYTLASGTPEFILARQQNEGPVINVATPPIRVLSGDYFTLRCQSLTLATTDILGGFTGVSALQSATWLSMEVLD